MTPSARWSLRFIVAALAAPTLAAAQPSVEIPSDEPQRAIPRPPGFDLPRESQIEVPLDRPREPGQASTGIGAYGEIVLNAPTNSDPAIVDVRRLVVFLGHNFTDRLRVYTELEVEHAIASSGDRGEFEVEQLFVDYLAWRWLNLRAGLILMPIGIVNQYHEPPTFNGADRPETDTRIIPSTWREVGAGFFGAAGPLRWQLYAVTSFKARDFSSDGLREGHQEGQLARARDWGVVGRLDVQPVPGLDVGAAGYYADSGQADQQIGLVRAGVTVVEADARFRWKGLEARAELANVWIGDTSQINAGRQKIANDSAASAGLPPPGPVDPVARQLRGGYVEVGYNVLQPFHLRYSSSLVVFGRYERTDTQAEVVALVPVVGKDRQLVTFGLNFRPVAEVAVKLDYQRIIARGTMTDPQANVQWNQISAALAFMF